ncbi:hypothetical protein Trydic_g19077 [Trypoxylus dichotomus]
MLRAYRKFLALFRSTAVSVGVRYTWEVQTMKFLSYLALSLAVLVQVSDEYPQRDAERTSENSQQVASTHEQEETDMLMEETEQNTKLPEANAEELNQDSQTFFESFSPFNNQPLGHSRPLYYQPEAAYSHRPSAYQQNLGFDSNTRFSGYKGDVYEDRSDANSILGSGNFGVIKGGTFYSENDDDQYGGFGNNYNSYYHNGHGRPSFYYGNSNRRPQQFENFRDFADINTPSYSEFVVVYANKNETHKQEVKIKQPKNIIERLAMLDLEQSMSAEITTTETSPNKKVSKSKRKLAMRLPEKKPIAKSGPIYKELYEPLLALS